VCVCVCVRERERERERERDDKNPLHEILTSSFCLFVKLLDTLICSYTKGFR